MDLHVNQIESYNNNGRGVEDGRRKRVKTDIEPSKQDNGDGVGADDKKSGQLSTHVIFSSIT